MQAVCAHVYLFLQKPNILTRRIRQKRRRKIHQRGFLTSLRFVIIMVGKLNYIVTRVKVQGKMTVYLLPKKRLKKNTGSLIQTNVCSISDILSCDKVSLFTFESIAFGSAQRLLINS